jgi:hypothetical protein
MTASTQHWSFHSCGHSAAEGIWPATPAQSGAEIEEIVGFLGQRWPAIWTLRHLEVERGREPAGQRPPDRHSRGLAYFDAAYELYAHIAVAEKEAMKPERLATLVANLKPNDLAPDEGVAYDFSYAAPPGVSFPWFGRFVSTTGLSDFSSAYMLGVRLLPSRASGVLLFEAGIRDRARCLSRQRRNSTV